MTQTKNKYSIKSKAYLSIVNSLRTNVQKKQKQRNYKKDFHKISLPILREKVRLAYL